MNIIKVTHLHLEWNGSCWEINDHKLGLLAEPFVGKTNDGIIKVISMLAKIPIREVVYRVPKVSLVFSTEEFPGYHHKLELKNPSLGGGVYELSALNLDGWLCRALHYYFPEGLPESIYIQFLIPEVLSKDVVPPEKPTPKDKGSWASRLYKLISF